MTFRIGIAMEIYYAYISFFTFSLTIQNMCVTYDVHKLAWFNVKNQIKSNIKDKYISYSFDLLNA